jgi:peptide/nickel transport system permease protein
MAMTGISTPAFWLGLGVIVLFYGTWTGCPAAAGWTTGLIRRPA